MTVIELKFRRRSVELSRANDGGGLGQVSFQTYQGKSLGQSSGGVSAALQAEETAVSPILVGSSSAQLALSAQPSMAEAYISRVQAYVEKG